MAYDKRQDGNISSYIKNNFNIVHIINSFYSLKVDSCLNEDQLKNDFSLEDSYNSQN